MKKIIKIILWAAAAIVAVIVALQIISSRPVQPKNCNALTNVVYKTVGNDTLKLAVYTPKDSLKKHPAVIYFHGGSWISGNSSKVFLRYRSYTSQMLFDNHIAIVSVDYRLINMKGNHLEDCLEDCQDAIRFCIENGDSLGIDSARIGLWGSSAGSHLAMLCYGKRDSDPDSNYRHIKYLINDFGPVDILEMWHSAPEWIRQMASTYFYNMDWPDMEIFDSLSIAYSPIQYTKKLSEIPMLIHHGTDDRIVDFRQSVMLHDSLPKSELILLKGAGHGFKGIADERVTDYVSKILQIIE
ncbi:MAG: alpha/beta hydrolase [Bacteroidales bacterium]|nr:alpha/beta hydrolase [Bacteroidales bacterium]